MDNWAIRYPTNVLDVARVLVDISIKSLEPSIEIPKILHFSTQKKMTKVDVCQLLAKLSGIELTKENFISVDDGPKLHLGETNRPKDCHLSNVNRAFFCLSIYLRIFVSILITCFFLSHLGCH